jgi:hypothetical protein
MFVSMRRYSPKNGAITRASLDLLRRQVHADFLPKIQGISGFRGYYLVNIENREIVTLSIYDTAMHSVRRGIHPPKPAALRAGEA